MRGDDIQQGAMFSYLAPEQRVPANHPLRPIRKMVDTVLKRLSARFEAMDAEGGRPAIAPEKLLRALVLQCLYSVRSERRLMEQLDYNLLFRWFVGLNMDDPIWDFTVFSKNRERACCKPRWRGPSSKRWGRWRGSKGCFRTNTSPSTGP